MNGYLGANRKPTLKRRKSRRAKASKTTKATKGVSRDKPSGQGPAKGKSPGRPRVPALPTKTLDRKLASDSEKEPVKTESRDSTPPPKFKPDPGRTLVRAVRSRNRRLRLTAATPDIARDADAKLLVKVRDFQFPIRMRAMGEQNLLWLAGVAKARYARYTRMLVDTNELVVTGVENAVSGMPIDPRAVVRDAIAADANPAVRVLLERVVQPQRASQWQLTAQTPREAFTPLTIAFDGTRDPNDADSDVILYTSLDAYREPQFADPEDDDGDGLSGGGGSLGEPRKQCPPLFSLRVPYGLQVRFFFDVGGVKRLAKGYSTTTETVPGLENATVNATMIRTSTTHLTPPVLNAATWRRGGRGKHGRGGNTGPGAAWAFCFPPETLSRALELDRFRRDWRDIDVSDMVEAVAGRLSLRDMMQNWHVAACRFFRLGSRGSAPTDRISRSEFIAAVASLKLDERMLPAGSPGRIFDALRAADDEDNAGRPRRAEAKGTGKRTVSRAKFIEAVIRIAAQISAQQPVAMAVQVLFSKRIAGLTSAELRKSMAHRVQSETCAEAFEPFLKKLYKQEFAPLTHGSPLARATATLSYPVFAAWFRKAFADNRMEGAVEDLVARALPQIFALSVTPRTGDLDRMGWAHFLDALARTALLARPKRSLPGAIREVCKHVLSARQRAL